MNRKILSLLIGSLSLAPVLAQAENPYVFRPLVDGLAFDSQPLPDNFIDIGGRYTSNGLENSAKAQEYMDLTTGLLVNGQGSVSGDQGQIRFKGEELGRDDQALLLLGRWYGLGTLAIFNNKIPHNVGFGPQGTITPLVGTGTNFLFAIPRPANLNLLNWGQVDFTTQRDTWGLGLNLKTSSPFYFRLGADETNKNGVLPTAGPISNGTPSPGGQAADLPAPIDWRWNTVSGEVGYNVKNYLLSFAYTHGSFSNSNPVLLWQDPLNNAINGVPGRGGTTLPPGSIMDRYSAEGPSRNLPYSGSLTGSATWTSFSTSVNTALFGNTDPASLGFNGETTYKTVSAAYYVAPIQGGDARLYYNYVDRETSGTSLLLNYGGVGETPTPQNYVKNNVGLDLNYRINRANKVSAGYEYTSWSYNREDYNRSIYNRYYATWKNTSLEMMDASLKYQYLQRRSNFINETGTTNPFSENFGEDANNQAFLNNFIAKWDVADLDQNLVKATFNVYPLEMYAAGLELIYADNNYPTQALGRTGNTRYGAYLSGNYNNPEGIKVSAFLDWEYVYYNSLHRSVAGVGGDGNCNAASPDCFNPFTAPNANNFNWLGKVQSKNWATGIGVDWPFSERLVGSANLLWEQSGGDAGFNVQSLVAPTVPIVNNNDYRKWGVNLKGTYAFQKQWELVGGYSWERYYFDDVSVNGYQYVFQSGSGTNPLPVTQTNYLSGLFSTNPYAGYSVYLLLRYRFGN